MLILGHRGCRRLHRDNSINAISFALANNADGVEIDIRWDPVEELVKLAHDPIKNSDELITFEHALPLLKKFKGEVQLEVKPQPPHFYNKINEIILPHCQREQNWRVTSFDKHYLKTLPIGQKSGLLIEHPYPNPALCANLLGCSALAVRQDLLNKRLLQQIKRHRLSVTVWTENSLTKAKQWRKKKVDLLITDRPHLIR